MKRNFDLKIGLVVYKNRTPKFADIQSETYVLDQKIYGDIMVI